MNHSILGLKNWKSAKYLMTVIILLNFSTLALGQETVFLLFKNNLVRADHYAEEKKYKQAIELYKTLVEHSVEGEIELKIVIESHNKFEISSQFPQKLKNIFQSFGDMSKLQSFNRFLTVVNLKFC